jgi:hypothetical protein
MKHSGWRHRPHNHHNGVLIMKTIFAAALLAASFAVLPAQAGDRPHAEGQLPTIADGARAFPALTTIYRFSGVRNTIDAQETGTATVFLCSNYSATTQQVRIVVRADGATVVGDRTFEVPARDTTTASTKFTVAFFDDKVLLPIPVDVNQGNASIQATNANVHCTAMIVGAAAATPIGIALSPVRFLPAPGSME